MGERFLIDRILERGSLSVHFQPVLDMQAPRPEAHYLEALIRGPRGTIAEAPTILFEYARKKNKEALVDRTCVEAILDAALRVPADTRLGINVHASSLAMDGGFVDFLESALEARGISPLRLIVEIVEHAPPWDVVSFRAALAGLRRLGARVVAEGVEDPAEMETLKRIGIRLVQGFLFGRPAPATEMTSSISPIRWGGGQTPPPSLTR